MQRLVNITSQADQTHIIPYFDTEINFRLYYLSPVQGWFFDVSFRDSSVFGVKLCLGATHLIGFNLPFDFVCVDNSEFKLEPILKSDFESNRIDIFLVSQDELFEFRPVEIKV